jgi:hypothetical protein
LPLLACARGAPSDKAVIGEVSRGSSTGGDALLKVGDSSINKLSKGQRLRARRQRRAFLLMA